MRQVERMATRKVKEVYGHIRAKGTISKVDLKQVTGLTTSTLTRLLEELVQEGWIEEVGFGESRGGRRPILYRTNARYAYVFGLEISRSVSRLLLCDLHLNKLAVEVWPMNRYMTPERLMEEVVRSIGAMMRERDLESTSMLGLGIGTVGPLDREGGIILNPMHFAAAGWLNVAIGPMLERQLGFPVHIDNGANAALLGEYWTQANSGIQHLLYVHAGVGLRSAMIMGGEIVYGAVDMEGAVGQMIIQADGPPSRQEGGNCGSWETYVSAYALQQAAVRGLKLGRETLLWSMVTRPEEVTYPMLERALAQGDEMVRELFLQAASYFGIGLSNLLNILHPEKVVLGGPLVSGNALFFEQAVRVARSKTYHYPQYDVSFEQSGLGDDAVATGAAAIMLKKVTE
ncbi:ROK family protein [Paenibacillus chungangensis]|uniref:ROK family protein n=1 Tax=Paenibacillus chungangensis TaxID=696535 RepID=A0ABW3HL16_9BACL